MNDFAKVKVSVAPENRRDPVQDVVGDAAIQHCNPRKPSGRIWPNSGRPNAPVVADGSSQLGLRAKQRHCQMALCDPGRGGTLWIGNPTSIRTIGLPRANIMPSKSGEGSGSLAEHAATARNSVTIPILTVSIALTTPPRMRRSAIRDDWCCFG